MLKVYCLALILFCICNNLPVLIGVDVSPSYFKAQQFVKKKLTIIRFFSTASCGKVTDLPTPLSTPPYQVGHGTFLF